MKLTDLTQTQRAQVERTRQVVAQLHALLPAWELVVWTAGNVSERVPGTDLFVIKASGVAYEGMEAAHMVVCDLQGQLLDDDDAGSLLPRIRQLTPTSIGTCLKLAGWCTPIPPTPQLGRQLANLSPVA